MQRKDSWVAVVAFLTGGALWGPAWAGAPYTADKKATAAYAAAKAAGADVKANPKEGDATAIAAGKDLYTTKCMTCHGDKADGKGPAAIALDPAPADFTNAERWAASTAGTKQWIVLNGIQGTGMVPPGLDADQAWSVLAYLQATYHAAP